MSTLLQKNNPRIGIDFHLLDKIYQGAQTHIIELFAEVIRLSPDFDFYLFCSEPKDLLRLHSAFGEKNVFRIKMAFRNPVFRLLWQIPRLVQKHKIDLFHAQYILPLFMKAQGVVTIHDILFEKYPEYFEPFFRFRSRLLMRRSARCANHVFTVSHFSQDEIKSRYGVHGQKISVIYNGVNQTRFFSGSHGVEVLSRWGLLSGEYLLTVGRMEPRKNHVALLRAYSKLRSKTMPLVIVGQRDFRFHEIDREIEKLGLQDSVLILENVSFEELPALYRYAKLFVYPTWAEGFGMPVLEAMASGVPVITSNTTSLPEVAGDAAELIDPADVNSLAEAIQNLLDHPKIGKELIAKGYKQIKKFSWVESAQKVRSVYLNLLGK